MLFNTVTVCINYCDMFKITYEFNKNFCNYIIITSEEDLQTINFCKEKNIEYRFISKEFCSNNVFNKGKMINLGLEYFYNNPDIYDHYLILDSDIILNPDMNKLNLNNLNRKCIYGANRYLIETYEEFRTTCSEATKVDWKEVDNYSKQGRPGIGVGYFQLFSEKKYYEEDHIAANKTDNLFAWSFEKILDIGYDVIHLGLRGQNWYGRTTEVWKN